jgi:ribosomal protein S18 acetylase RimI-like enzyme
MLVEKGLEVVGTCHLTLMPSLTFQGRTRLQIEAVRVVEKYRGQKIGAWMMQEALNYGQSKGATLVQLTTHKTRSRAKSFYEDLGFEVTHDGMKLFLEETASLPSIKS